MATSSLTKFVHALTTLNACLGQKGVWADPTRYQEQCWTRDLALAVAPLLMQLGQRDVVRRHLVNLSAQQQPNGQIPILFLDDEARFLSEKERKSREQGRESFMLRRYREGELWNLTPGTKDSEIQYLLAMYEYVEKSGDESLLYDHARHMDAALAHIEKVLMQDGLTLGCDWRDTMHEELGHLPLLTNNCLLHQVYQFSKSWSYPAAQKAANLKRRIHDVLCPNGTFMDFPGSTRFDPLGGALAVLCDVAEPRHFEGLVASFQSVDTPYGVTIKCRHNPVCLEEKTVIERTDGLVVWPFVVGFATLALHRMGYFDLARQQFEKLLALEGFREWYDPATGKGYGADAQLWSAALYARALFQLQ